MVYVVFPSLNLPFLAQPREELWSMFQHKACRTKLVLQVVESLASEPPAPVFKLVHYSNHKSCTILRNNMHCCFLPRWQNV